MTIKNGDLPAMPVEHMDYMHVKDKPYCNGLTKREYFAALAMQGLVASGVDWTLFDHRDVSEQAVIIADKMLAELERIK